MKKMIPERESLTVEFKSDIKKYPDSEIFDAIVAFANTEGGELYLGVENDGTITGVNQAHSNPTTLSAYVANNTVPPVSIRAEILNEEKKILKISVAKSAGSIVATGAGKVLRRRLKIDGTPENIPMYPVEMATRLSDLRLLDYSAMPVFEATLRDFDPLEVERLRKLVRAYDGDKSLVELEEIDLFKALGFVREHREEQLIPTITGLLMVGRVESIKRFVPTASGAFQVLEGTKVRINDDFVMPILASIEKLNTYLDAWNPQREIEFGMFRMPAPDFDKRALREAIVNAFSHRDYSKMGRVRVAINDEGLMVANPGGFIEGISADNLLNAEPHGRNPLLSDALKRVGLAEKTGRGIDRIFEGSLVYGRHLPDYSASTAVTVSLFIPRCSPDLQIARMISDEQNRIGHALPINTLLVLNMLKDLPKSNVCQLAEACHLSEIVVKSILDKSIESGLVEAYGSGRGRSYMLSHKIYHTKEKNIGYVQQADIDEARYLELVMNMAKKNEYIARADVMELLHISDSKAYRLLKKLVKENRLEPIHKGRYAKYKAIVS